MNAGALAYAQGILIQVSGILAGLSLGILLRNLVRRRRFLGGSATAITGFSLAILTAGAGLLLPQFAVTFGVNPQVIQPPTTGLLMHGIVALFWLLLATAVLFLQPYMTIAIPALVLVITLLFVPLRFQSSAKGQLMVKADELWQLWLPTDFRVGKDTALVRLVQWIPGIHVGDAPKVDTQP